MSDLDTLARTIWGEERSLGGQAMTAVACVVLNRVARQGWQGLTITEVCKKPMQFDCWNVNDPNYLKLLNVTSDDHQFSIAQSIAQKAIEGSLDDITNGGVSYYNTTIPEPSWAKGHTPCASFGNMLVYNDID